MNFTKVKKAQKPLHVELGSGKLSGRAKAGMRSIDYRTASKSKNHQRADFLSGLSKLKDGSADSITANASLGYYTRNAGQTGILRTQPLNPASLDGKKIAQYTSRVLCVAHKKLKPGGQAVVRIDEDFIELFMHAIKQSPFRGVSIQELEKEKLRTPWLRIIGAQRRVFEITLKKAA